MKNLPQNLKVLELISPSRNAYWDLERAMDYVPQTLSSFKIDDFDGSFLNDLENIIKKLPKNITNLTITNHGSENLNLLSLNNLLKIMPTLLESLDFSLNVKKTNRWERPAYFDQTAKDYIDVTHLPRLHTLKLDGLELPTNIEILSAGTQPLSYTCFPSADSFTRRILQGERLSYEEIKKISLETLNVLSDYAISRQAKVKGEIIYYIASLIENSARVDLPYTAVATLTKAMELYELSQAEDYSVNQVKLGNLAFDIALLYENLEPNNPTNLQDHSRRPTLEKRDQYLIKALKYGRKDVRYKLGVLYKKGEIKRDYFSSNERQGRIIAFELLFPLAKEGNAKAQHNIGMIYYGLGNNVKAIEYLKRAAEGGLGESQRNLEKFEQNKLAPTHNDRLIARDNSKHLFYLEEAVAFYEFVQSNNYDDNGEELGKLALEAALLYEALGPSYKYNAYLRERGLEKRNRYLAIAAHVGVREALDRLKAPCKKEGVKQKLSLKSKKLDEAEALTLSSPPAEQGNPMLQKSTGTARTTSIKSDATPRKTVQSSPVKGDATPRRALKVTPVKHRLTPRSVPPTLSAKSPSTSSNALSAKPPKSDATSRNARQTMSAKSRAISPAATPSSPVKNYATSRRTTQTTPTTNHGTSRSASQSTFAKNRTILRNPSQATPAKSRTTLSS